MKHRKLIILITLVLIITCISIPAYAAETTKDNAVASVTMSDSTVKYYDSITEAVSKAEDNDQSTLQLLQDVKADEKIVIDKGSFKVDLNGKTLENSHKNINCIDIKGGTICFTDSSSNKTGSVKGGSSAIWVDAAEKVVIESGNYLANSWTVYVGSETVSIDITGGHFDGNIALQIDSAKDVAVSGGDFDGRQTAFWNNDVVTITGGTFYGGITNIGEGTLNFKGGNVVVGGEGYAADCGFENNGTLNLYGGKISVAENVTRGASGVKCSETAELNIYDDVNFQGVKTDFELADPMNICGILNGVYRVVIDMPENCTEEVFANASNGAQISASNFVSGRSGYVVALTKDNSSLLISRCHHEKIDNKFACDTCGIQMYARIGDKYYESLPEALSVVKDNQTVELLADISEDINIDHGDFILDLNGNSIEASLSVTGGKVTVRGNANGQESIRNLSVEKGADVEVAGATISEGVQIIDSATFTMRSGTISGNEFAVLNIGGTVSLLGGEVSAEDIAVMNLGGTVTIGSEDGTGPYVKAPLGILNGIIDADGNDMDSVLNINGGEITADVDIYNKTGDLSPEENFEFPVKAGKVVLTGGTFTGGISVVLDEGIGLTDLLSEDYGYFGNNGQMVSVDEDDVQLEQTVTVKHITEGNAAEPETDAADEPEINNDRETDSVKTGDDTTLSGLLLVLITAAVVCIAAGKTHRSRIDK